MLRTALALVAISAMLHPAPARADEDAPGQPEQTPVVERSPEDAADEDPWATYERAFSAAVAGREEEALRELSQLQALHPGSGAAALGTELSRQLESRRGRMLLPPDAGLRRALDAKGPASAAGAPSAAGTQRHAALFDALHDEAPTGAARAELIVFQMLHGLAVGAEVCVASSGCGGVGGVLLVPMLAGGAGAFGAVMFSREGITAGHTLAINSGTLWAAWQALALTAITDTWSVGATPLLLIASQAAGMVGGHFAWAGLGLAAGDVSLINTAGLWAGVYTLAGLYLSGVNGSVRGLFGALLVASDVGLVAGALLARRFPMSRGRTLLLDAGGILGGLLGLAVYVAVAPDGPGRGTVGAMLAGSVAGMAGAAALSRDWDTPLLGPLQIGLAPTRDGGGQLLVSTRF